MLANTLGPELMSLPFISHTGRFLGEKRRSRGGHMGLRKRIEATGGVALRVPPPRSLWVLGTKVLTHIHL